MLTRARGVAGGGGYASLSYSGLRGDVGLRCNLDVTICQTIHMLRHIIWSSIILSSQYKARNIFGIILRGKVKLPWRAAALWCVEIIQIKMQRPRIEIATQISSFSLTSTSLRILRIWKVKIANSVILSKAINAAQENCDWWWFTVLLVKVGHVSLH